MAVKSFNPLLDGKLAEELRRLANAKPSKSIDISITDIIDDFWGYGPTALQRQIKEAGKLDEINVTINSPGGSAFDGIAIYNILKQNPARVNVNVIALAASAASIVAMAGDSIAMGEGAFLMIHNASGIVLGTADDMRDFADMLSKLDGELVKIYARRTGRDEKQIAKWMAAETWFTGEEAVGNGFAHERIEDDSSEAVAALSPDKMKIFAYRHAPESIAAYFAANKSNEKPAREPKPMPAPELKEEAEEMDLATLTLEELRTGRPELVSQIETAAKSISAEAVIAATNEERARCATIMTGFQSMRSRFPACTAELHKIAYQSITNGDKDQEATAAMKDAVLAASEKETPPDTGLNADPDNHVRKLAADTPEGWKAEYAASASLQEEFGSEETYLAFKTANKAGRVAILHQK